MKKSKVFHLFDQTGMLFFGLMLILFVIAFASTLATILGLVLDALTSVAGGGLLYDPGKVLGDGNRRGRLLGAVCRDPQIDEVSLLALLGSWGGWL